MEHLFRPYIFFQLLLSSSVSSHFCGLHYEQAKGDNAPLEFSDVPEVPWLVNIYGNGKRCQGIVLSSWWVLTAANCFLLMNPSQVELTESHGHFSTKRVNQFLLHRGFTSWNTAPNNDLGLILLDQSIDLRRNDMWLACIIMEKKSYDAKDQCMIFERGDNEDTKLLLKSTKVEALDASECSKHWPGTKDKLNLCIARKEIPKNRDCTVPIGSSVICSNPATSKWEVMGIVSQSLHNCSAPILAAQLLTHLKWLWQVGSLENPLLQEIELFSATTTVETSSATQQVPIASSSHQTTNHVPLSEAQQNVTSTTSSQQNLTCTKSVQQNVTSSPSVQQNVTCTSVQQNVTSTSIQQNVTSTTSVQQNVTSTTSIQQNITCTTSSQSLSQTASSTTGESSEISSITEQKSVTQTSTVTLPTTIPRQSEPSPFLDIMVAPSMKSSSLVEETDVNGGLPIHLSSQ